MKPEAKFRVFNLGNFVNHPLLRRLKIKRQLATEMRELPSTAAGRLPKTRTTTLSCLLLFVLFFGSLARRLDGGDLTSCLLLLFRFFFDELAKRRQKDGNNFLPPLFSLIIQRLYTLFTVFVRFFWPGMMIESERMLTRMN